MLAVDLYQLFMYIVHTQYRKITHNWVTTLPGKCRLAPRRPANTSATLLHSIDLEMSDSSSEGYTTSSNQCPRTVSFVRCGVPSIPFLNSNTTSVQLCKPVIKGITNGTNLGTCFCVGQFFGKTLFATALHTLLNGGTFQMMEPEGTLIACKLEYENDEDDIAILSVDSFTASGDALGVKIEQDNELGRRGIVFGGPADGTDGDLPAYPCQIVLQDAHNMPPPCELPNLLIEHFSLLAVGCQVTAVSGLPGAPMISDHGTVLGMVSTSTACGASLVLAGSYVRDAVRAARERMSGTRPQHIRFVSFEVASRI